MEEAGRAGARGSTSARDRLLALALLVLADLAFLHELWLPLASLGHWGIWDWDYQMSLVEAARTSLLEYGELPLWNPWLGGGSTLVGHPLARTFNPSFLPVLLLGTVAGLKLDVLLYLLIGQLGMFRLARHFGAGNHGAGLAALVFSWSGVYAQHLTHGHVEWMAYAWVPWLIFALERAFVRADRARIAGAGLVLALVWLDGGPYQYAFVPLMLGVYAAAVGARERSWQPLFVLAASGAIAVGVAALQLAPVIDTVLEFPRETAASAGRYGGRIDPSLWDAIHQALFSRRQTHDPAVYMPFRINLGAYVGGVPVALAVLALAMRIRRLWPLALSLAFALVLFLSDHLPVSLWEWIHPLPGFSSLRNPARFNFFVVLWLALFAGLGLERLLTLRFVPEARRRTLALGISAVVAVDLFLVCAPVFGWAFVVPPFEPGEIGEKGEPGAFRQHESSPYRGLYARRAERRVWNDHFPNETLPLIGRNEGAIRGYPGIHFPRRAIPFDYPDYPGAEVFAAGAGRVLDLARSPNRIRFTTEGKGGRFVVNQNHQRWWRVLEGEAGRVEPFRGLLSVRVPAGRHEITLGYRPLPFYLGAALSLTSILGVAFALRSGRAR